MRQPGNVQRPGFVFGLWYLGIGLWLNGDHWPLSDVCYSFGLPVIALDEKTNAQTVALLVEILSEVS